MMIVSNCYEWASRVVCKEHNLFCIHIGVVWVSMWLNFINKLFCYKIFSLYTQRPEEKKYRENVEENFSSVDEEKKNVIKMCVCILKLFLAPRPNSLILMLISLPLASIMLCKLHLWSFEIFHFIKSCIQTRT